MKKEYNSPEFDLYALSFEKILQDSEEVMDPSGGEIGIRDGGEGPD